MRMWLVPIHEDMVPFIVLLTERNKMGLKYQPGCFPALH